MFFAAILVYSGNGQVKKPTRPLKVAIYNEYAFSSEKTGITKLLDAWKTMGFYDCFDSDREKCERGYNRRVDMIVGPVLDEIHADLKQIALRNDVVILDGRKLEEEAKMLAWDPRIDITDQLIRAFNHQNLKSRKYRRLDIKAGTIAAIDTKNKKFIEVSKAWKLAEIFQSFGNYARKRGLVLVLNGSLPKPQELDSFMIEDSTEDFIRTCTGDLGKPGC